MTCQTLQHHSLTLFFEKSSVSVKEKIFRFLQTDLRCSSASPFCRKKFDCSLKGLNYMQYFFFAELQTLQMRMISKIIPLSNLMQLIVPVEWLFGDNSSTGISQPTMRCQDKFIRKSICLYTTKLETVFYFPCNVF